MKKSVFLITALLFATMSVTALDFIYKRNQAGRISVNEVDILTNETNYKLFGDESGQVYSLDNNQISMIAYENGDIRFFEKEKRVINRNNNKKNIIHYHLFDLIVNNGIVFTPVEALSISMVGSLGIRYTDKTDRYNDRNVKTVGAFSANLSCRF